MSVRDNKRFRISVGAFFYFMCMEFPKTWYEDNAVNLFYWVLTSERILLYLLPDGSRMNRLLLASFQLNAKKTILLHWSCWWSVVRHHWWTGQLLNTPAVEPFHPGPCTNRARLWHFRSWKVIITRSKFIIMRCYDVKSRLLDKKSWIWDEKLKLWDTNSIVMR